MGLNNVGMGHSPGDRVGQKNHAAFSVPVFWELRPDLVVPRFVESDRTMRSTENWLVERSSYYLHDLLSTPRFRDEYRVVVFPRPGSPEYPLLVTYCRRDWLAGRAGALQWVDYATLMAQNGVTLHTAWLQDAGG